MCAIYYTKAKEMSTKLQNKKPRVRPLAFVWFSFVHALPSDVTTQSTRKNKNWYKNQNWVKFFNEV